MMLKKSFVLAAVIASVAAVAGFQDAADLKLNVKEGQTLKTRITAKVDYQGTPIEVSGLSVFTVKSVADGKVVSMVESKEMVIDLGGTTMEQPDSSLTLTQNDRGRILGVSGDMATEEANRLQSTFNFFYPEKPVKVGDKWEQTIPADAKLNTREIKGSYEAVEIKDWKGKKSMVLKVSQSEGGEMPISMSGLFTIELATGLPLMMDISFKNLPQQGFMFDGTWKAEAVD